MQGKRPVSRYSRTEKLLQGLDIEASTGIEIGALATPLLRPPRANIRFVDHCDTQALRQKYAGDKSVLSGDIVSIDAVWGDRTLAECFPGEQFDYVIASHVIEHVPNLIGWLLEIAEVLRTDGRLILAIPDRRYSFDVRRRETALSELIDHYLQNVRRPTPGQVFDVHANSVVFDHVAAWSSNVPLQSLTPYVTLADALAKAMESRDGQYIDGHCSVFTARSLLELLDGLLELRMLPFRLDRFHVAEVGSAEMSLILLRQPPGADRTATWNEIRALLAGGIDTEGLPLDTLAEGELTTGDAAERIASLERAIAEIRASTSWRLTKPLRALARALGSERNGF